MELLKWEKREKNVHVCDSRSAHASQFEMYKRFYWSCWYGFETEEGCQNKSVLNHNTFKGNIYQQ